MKIRSAIFSLALALALTLGSKAHATGILDFGVVAPTTGTISFAGGTAPLVGTNIQVDEVVGDFGTPLNDGVVRNCIGCVLNFTTGAATAGTWNFGPGGSITIVGGVDLNNNGILDGGDVPANTTLLSGTLNGAMIIVVSNQLRIAGAAFVDVKDADLAAFYGLPGGPGVPYAGGFNLGFLSTVASPNAFSSSQVTSGDIVNMPVDLPSSLLLLGSGLVGFAYLTARSRRS
jgi:hypothetical protein